MTRPHPALLRARARAVALATPLVLLAIAAAACGGGGTTNASSSATTAPSSAASESAFRACLQQHGVTLPTRPTGSTGGGGGGFGGGGGGFGGGGGGFSGNPNFAAAFQACASLRPQGSGGFGRGSGGQSAALTAYLNCLQTHGVTVPTSGAGEGTALRQLLTDPTAEEKTAVTACASLRPALSGRPGTAPSTTTTTAA